MSNAEEEKRKFSEEIDRRQNIPLPFWGGVLAFLSSSLMFLGFIALIIWLLGLIF